MRNLPCKIIRGDKRGGLVARRTTREYVDRGRALFFLFLSLGVRFASMTSIVPSGRVLRRIRRNYDDNLRGTEGGVGILPGIVIPDITLGLKGMRLSRPLFWASV